MNRRQVLSRTIGTALSVGLLTAPFTVVLPQLPVFISQAEAATAASAQADNQKRLSQRTFVVTGTVRRRCGKGLGSE